MKSKRRPHPTRRLGCAKFKQLIHTKGHVNCPACDVWRYASWDEVHDIFLRSQELYRRHWND